VPRVLQAWLKGMQSIKQAEIASWAQCRRVTVHCLDSSAMHLCSTWTRMSSSAFSRRCSVGMAVITTLNQQPHRRCTRSCAVVKTRELRRDKGGFVVSCSWKPQAPRRQLFEEGLLGLPVIYPSAEKLPTPPLRHGLDPSLCWPSSTPTVQLDLCHEIAWHCHWKTFPSATGGRRSQCKALDESCVRRSLTPGLRGDCHCNTFMQVSNLHWGVENCRSLFWCTAIQLS